MRKMKKFLTLAMTATLLFSSMTVNAAPAITAKQNADYMMSTNVDGAPNWFSGKYYSDRYEDLKIAFNTNEKALYNHSLQYGFDESRLVTPVLDVTKYRAFYPDLQNAFGDNWKLYVRHYFEYGINEGRENFTDFDAQAYLNKYDDLQNAFGTDLGLATRHYIEYGYDEGRDWSISIGFDFTFDSESDDESSDSSSSNNGSSDSGSSDSGSSDNDNTDESFTGDKRVELYDNMYAIETYVNGVVTAVTKYNSDGTVEDKTTFTYDENGNMTSEKNTWANGYSAEATYENGVRTYQVDIYIDGTKVEAEFYEDGETQKKFTEIYTDGTKVVIEKYENGNLKSRTDYDTSGNMTIKQLYDEDGNLISETDYTIATTSNATPAE